VTRLIETALMEAGKIDVLVNNVFAPYSFNPEQRGQGCIVSMASDLVHRPNPLAPHRHAGRCGGAGAVSGHHQPAITLTDLPADHWHGAARAA
jgi:hypothetical protein